MSVVLRIILIVTSLLFNALVLNMVRIGRVEMRYKPPLKTAGMWLSGSSLGVLGLCLPALWITHRK